MEGGWWKAARSQAVLLGVGVAWTVLGVGFLAVGAAAVARGPGNIPSHLRMRAEGVVTGVASTRMDPGKPGTRYDELQVRFTGPGGDAVVTSVVWARPQDGSLPRLGEKVWLVYSALEPERAHLEKHSFKRGLLAVPAGFTLAGAALLALGVRRARKDSAASPTGERGPGLP